MDPLICTAPVTQMDLAVVTARQGQALIGWSLRSRWTSVVARACVPRRGPVYEPGASEDLAGLDIDGTVVVIHSELWPGPPAWAPAEFVDVVDSIRIERSEPART